MHAQQHGITTVILQQLLLPLLLLQLPQLHHPGTPRYPHLKASAFAR
jgi:hypothetical protein